MIYNTFGITQHDNTACFVWTVNNIITLSNRKFNVPEKVCKSVSNTRQNTRYTIVTKSCASQQHYKHMQETPIHGSGQGSGNTGTKWNFLSNLKINLMEKHTERCNITGPNGDTWKNASLC